MKLTLQKKPETDLDYVEIYAIKLKKDKKIQGKINEKHLLMLLSESSLKKTWNNKYDERWDDVL